MYESRVCKEVLHQMDYLTPTEAAEPQTLNFDDLHTLVLMMGVAVLSLSILLFRSPSGDVLNAEQIILMPYWGP
jgi:hypothetical protein